MLHRILLIKFICRGRSRNACEIAPLYIYLHCFHNNLCALCVRLKFMHMLTFTNDSRANSFLLALPEFCSQDDYALKSRLIESVIDSLCKAYGRCTVRSVIGRFFTEFEFIPRDVQPGDLFDKIFEDEVNSQGSENVAKSDCSNW